jgi:hypothetical protein
MLNNGDISDIKQYAANYVPVKNLLLRELFDYRPLKEIQHAAALFEAEKFAQCIDNLKDAILAKKVAIEYYHTALGYICICYGHMRLFDNCRLVIEEMKKVPLPDHYKPFGQQWEKRLAHELDIVTAPPPATVADEKPEKKAK